MREFRTSDMALVSFLKLNGMTQSDVAWSDGTCYWFFDYSDELDALVGRYNTGSGLVEPVSFNRMFSAVKREFYDTKPAISA